MFSAILLCLAGMLIFRIGYYIGHQIGRTEPVREHLRRSRENTPPPTVRLDADLVSPPR